MPTVRAGLMMTNVPLCRLQQQHGCAAEKEQEKKNAEGLIRERACVHICNDLHGNKPSLLLGYL